MRRGLRAAGAADGPGQLGGTVRVTGYGPARSRRQAAALAGEQFGALAVAGVGGGLTDDLAPGDLVVGTEVRDSAGHAVRCPAAPLLAGELRRAGLRAHAGPVVTTDRLAGGAARQPWRPAVRSWPTWSPPRWPRRRAAGRSPCSARCRTLPRGRC